MLTTIQKQEIAKHSEEAFPNECCGFVTANGTLRTENVSKMSKSEFSISSRAYLYGMERGASAIYHSHPHGFNNFSSKDRFSQSEYDLPLVLYSCKSQKFNLIKSHDDPGVSFDLKEEGETLIYSDLKDKIRKAAIDSHPNECCGLVLKDHSFILCENKSVDKDRYFAIDIEEVEKYSGEVEYVFHSHHNDFEAVFSDADEQIATKLGVKYVLFNVLSDEFKEFEPLGELPLEGRIFVPGTLDCVSLCQDYYKLLGFEMKALTDHPFRFSKMSKSFYIDMKTKWQLSSRTFLIDFYLNNGFREVPFPRVGDLIVSNSYDFVDAFTHLSIWMDPDVLDYGSDLISRLTDFESFKAKSNGEIRYLRHE